MSSKKSKRDSASSYLTWPRSSAACFSCCGVEPVRRKSAIHCGRALQHAQYPYPRRFDAGPTHTAVREDRAQRGDSAAATVSTQLRAAWAALHRADAGEIAAGHLVEMNQERTKEARTDATETR